jgi:hypothetical protein
MYRFRIIENLLGKYKELDNQEIYFASPGELNDPMEGFQNIFWRGDKIVWTNFIINYVKSADNIFSLTLLLRDDRNLDENDIPVLSHSSSYRTKEHVQLIDQIIKRVFDNQFIKDLPESLANRANPVRRDELLSYIQIMHPFVINSISEVYFQNSITNKRFFYQELDSFSGLLSKSGNLADLTNKFEAESSKVGGVAEKFFSIINLVTQQTKLLAKYNRTDSKASSNGLFLIAEFPDKYLDQLEKSIYPDWYSASFLFECNDSAIWGHYGDKHKGVCLKFKVLENKGNFELNLETEYGYSSGPIIGMRPHVFRKVDYTSKHIEIDFFRSIGRLNRGELNAMWYSDSNGNLSVCGEHLNMNEDAWRDKYWENYYKRLNVKLDAWDREKEYRLIVNDDFIDYREKEKRKLKYDFNDLEGIIFGIKTDESDKMEILKIIEDKCKKNNRKQFDFYQAYYSSDSGKIETFKLNLIKFE